MNDSAVNGSYDEEPLYRHSKRAEWGMAILAWEQPSKRAYQFQDGELRVIKEGYYELLARVEQRPSDAGELIAELKRKAGMSQQALSSTGKAGQITLAEQIQIFRIEYPGGFQDENWTAKIRGDNAKRRLKGHRQAAIDEGREVLSKENFDQAIANGTHSEMVETLLGVLGRTNIIKPKEVDGLKQLAPEQHADYIEALRNLLHGEDPRHLRFDGLSGIQRSKGSWALATAAIALVHPESALCVSPTTVRKQSQVMGPGLDLGSMPTGRVYDRVLALVGRVKDLIAEAGLNAVDLMDIFDFMRLTLRPSARKLIE